jgi:hypothetical protein
MRVEKMPFAKMPFAKMPFAKMSFEKIVLEKDCAMRKLRFERGGLQAARNSAKIRGFSP